MHTLNKQLHSLLGSTNLLSQKANLVQGITQGRTTKSSELEQYEALELCNYLQQQKAKLPAKPPTPEAQKADRMRKKIIAIAHNMHWVTAAGKADMVKINNWASMQFGKKPLNKYTPSELPKLVSIFEEKVYKDNFLKKQ